MSIASRQTELEVIQQSVDRLLNGAERAASLFRCYSTPQVQQIVRAMARAGEAKAQFYAEWLVRETGYGNIGDNIKKNLDCSVGLLTRYRAADFIEPAIDSEKKIMSFPKPAGIIAALIPSTNPVMTVYYKAIIAMMTRNTVIFSPHPAARDCSIHAVDLMAEAAEGAGAPEGAIQTIRQPGLLPLNGLMESPRVSVILATGGANRVREAYRSGNPALGMGPGNPPCFVHESADIAIAASHIITSNSFDHGLPCVCESVVLGDRAIDRQLRVALGRSGGYFVGEEASQKLQDYLFRDTGLNPAALGKSALWIAREAGFSVPGNTQSLLVEIETAGTDEPFSQEKLFPVMGYMQVDGIEGAIATALKMLEGRGKGHSGAIHSRDPAVVARYAAALPVCRIAVNTQGVEGSSGVSTHLTRGPVIGTGFFGGSLVDDNIGPQHLVQRSRAAYPADAEISMEEFASAIAGEV
ncbi:MAG: aldehyde dehydrogenase family protein [Cyanobacteria bacterium SBLK]|nr:aldehyde dehydrogenase family protein [Cyanobacteria bacterium SBLK]